MPNSPEKTFSMIGLAPQESIIMMNANGEITYWNKAAEEMFGWAAEEVIGKNLHELIVPEKYSMSYEKGLEHFYKTGRGSVIDKTVELHARHRNGSEFVIELSLGAIHIHGEWHAIGVVRDVEKKKQLEFQLTHAEKMESVATLAGGIAHDFNNILASIIGFTELAMDDAEKDTVLFSNLNEVLIASNRARDLVRQILKFSRQTDTVPEPVHVKSVVEEAMKLVRASFPSTIDIRMNLKSRSYIFADPSQIHQIILNLCTNAQHAMEEGKGVLSVSLMDFSADEIKKQSSLKMEPGTYVRLSISDTGKGMTTDILSKAFTPFFTTKKQGEGSGMGLPVIHGIVTGLKGAIFPHSIPGKGSTFHIYLPAMEMGEVLDSSGKTDVSHQGGLILFVDDEAPIVKIGKKLLERIGYTVETAQGSEKALELFKADPSRYRLVITDLTMPRMTGIELAKQMTLIRPGIPIILCTGYDKNESIIKAMDGAGIKAVVNKPILSDEIAETIGRVLKPV